MADRAPLNGLHWSFSLAVYAEPEVAKTCLGLQNEFGVDVNILLLAAWAAANGRNLEAGDLARLDGEVAQWRQQVIHPLRAARTSLKVATFPLIDEEPALRLRTRIQDIELAAEQIEQAAIVTWLRAHPVEMSPTDGDAAEAVRAALVRVIDHARASRDGASPQNLHSRLEPIVVAVCRHCSVGETPGEEHHV